MSVERYNKTETREKWENEKEKAEAAAEAAAAAVAVAEAGSVFDLNGQHMTPLTGNTQSGSTQLRVGDSHPLFRKFVQHPEVGRDKYLHHRFPQIELSGNTLRKFLAQLPEVGRDKYLHHRLPQILKKPPSLIPMGDFTRITPNEDEEKKPAKRMRLEQLKEEVEAHPEADPAKTLELADPEADPAKTLELDVLEKKVDTDQEKMPAATKRCREKQKYFPQAQYHRMKAIAPPSKDKTLELLRRFDHYLQKNATTVIEHFDKYILQPNSPVIAGIRLINGDRYEIFVNDRAENGTGIFDWLMKEVEKERTNGSEPILKDRLEEIRNEIIVFANKRAEQDKRVPKGSTFQNHALIFTFGECERQDVHIDLAEKDHFQFGLLCTDNVPGTLEYKCQAPVMGEDCNLADVWDDIPPSLAENLLKNVSTKSLLEDFGGLLSVLKCTGTETSFPLGTVLSLPGNVPHAGPFSDKLRAVLFFTGTPPGGTPYSYDTQHSRTTLISEILRHNWIPLQKNDKTVVEHKAYLLTKWDLIGLQNDKFALNNMHHKHLIKFGKDILKTVGDPHKKMDIITTKAKKKWTEKNWEESWDTKSNKKGRANQSSRA